MRQIKFPAAETAAERVTAEQKPEVIADALAGQAVDQCRAALRAEQRRMLFLVLKGHKGVQAA